jgi:hypothetical protein
VLPAGSVETEVESADPGEEAAADIHAQPQPL